MDGKGGVLLKVVFRRMDCGHCMGGAIILRMFSRKKPLQRRCKLRRTRRKTLQKEGEEG